MSLLTLLRAAAIVGGCIWGVYIIAGFYELYLMNEFNSSDFLGMKSKAKQVLLVATIADIMLFLFGFFGGSSTTPVSDRVNHVSNQSENLHYSDHVVDEMDTRRCPECAETIKAAARVCRFCGSNIQPKYGSASQDVNTDHKAAITTPSRVTKTGSSESALASSTTQSQSETKSFSRIITIGFMAVLGIVVLIAIFIMPRIGEGSRTVSLPSQKPVPQAQTAPQVQAQPQTAQPQTSQDVEIKFNDGSVYLGKVNQGQPHGQGTMFYATGERYIGEFKNGLKEGLGTLTVANGNRYVGEYRNNERNGQGTFTWVSGDRYVGAYKNNLMNGQGTLTWTNGDRYIGEWRDGDRTGQGTFTSANGDRYVGEWKNNEMIGQNTQSAKTTQTLSYPHGRYVGETLNGKAHGLGTYTSAQSGTVYKGEFIADTFSGVGTMTWTDGSQFYGKWQNDVGVSGTLTLRNGASMAGVVKNGVFSQTR